MLLVCNLCRDAYKAVSVNEPAEKQNCTIVVGSLVSSIFGPKITLWFF